MSITKSLMSRKAWSYRLVELAAALVVFLSVTQIITLREDSRKREVPASEWMTISDIFVPDHEVGSNPAMIYDRTIKEHFRGFWVVEVQSVERLKQGVTTNVCSGSGVGDYATTDFLPESTVTWEWFLGRPCRIGPGTYRLVASVDMARHDWPTKNVSAYSNTFTVYPEGSMPHKPLQKRTQQP